MTYSYEKSIIALAIIFNGAFKYKYNFLESQIKFLILAT